MAIAKSPEPWNHGDPWRGRKFEITRLAEFLLVFADCSLKVRDLRRFFVASWPPGRPNVFREWDGIVGSMVHDAGSFLGWPVFFFLSS